MKLKFLSLICALGLFAFGTNAIAQDAKVKAPTMPTAPMDAQTKIEGKAIVTQILRSNGLTDEEIQKVLSNPNDTKSKIVCGACKEIEELTGYEDDTCGGHTTWETCGDYIVRPLIVDYIAKGAACAIVDKKADAICDSSFVPEIVVREIKKHCPEFNCPPK